MAEKTVIVCDVCDKQKGASNHWRRGCVVDATQTIVIIASSSPQTRQTGDVDLCGREHLNTWLSGKLDQIGNPLGPSKTGDPVSAEESVSVVR